MTCTAIFACLYRVKINYECLEQLSAFFGFKNKHSYKYYKEESHSPFIHMFGKKKKSSV